MPLSMHQSSVPLMLQMLGSLSAILDKADAYCTERKIEPAVMLNYRLAPDMHPLTRQVQMVTDQAKGAMSRLAGVEIPSFPDTETTFAELKARIAKTVDYVKSFTPEQINGAEDREVTLKLGSTEMKLKGSQYYFHFFVPNFYFHTSTAYDIIRHCGVPNRKRDITGSI